MATDLNRKATKTQGNYRHNSTELFSSLPKLGIDQGLTHARNMSYRGAIPQEGFLTVYLNRIFKTVVQSKPKGN